MGERRTDAAIDAAAKGDPGGRLTCAAQVPVWVERPRVGEVVFGFVSKLDADDDVRTFRKNPLSQPDSSLGSPCGAVKHGPGALHFPNRGFTQLGSTRVSFLS